MSRDELQPFIRYAEALALSVLSRDNAQLSNGYLTRAAMIRFKAGLRALEAYAKRFLMMLALMIERELKPNTREYTVSGSNTGSRACKSALTFTDQAPRYEYLPQYMPVERPYYSIHQEFPAHDLLARLSVLRGIIADPEARARRLAFHLSRNRPGPVLPPCKDAQVPRRYGTEVSTLYGALAARIVALSQERPPPLPPACRAPPRIRVIG